MLINNQTILTDKDPALRTKCTKVPLPLESKDKKILQAMIKYIRDSHDPEKQEHEDLRAAVGLAAPQIGITKQMIAIGIPGDDKNPDLEYALVNPVIISNSVQKAYLKSGESCLSVVPDHPGIVPRYARITVKGYDLLLDQEVTIRLRNYQAIVFQHEIDHLSGILCYDHIDQHDPEATIPDAIVIE